MPSCEKGVRDNSSELCELPKTISSKARRVDMRTREQQFADVNQSAPQEWRDEYFPGIKASGDSSGASK